jgi:hypothetical protein
MRRLGLIDYVLSRFGSWGRRPLAYRMLAGVLVREEHTPRREASALAVRRIEIR